MLAAEAQYTFQAQKNRGHKHVQTALTLHCIASRERERQRKRGKREKTFTKHYLEGNTHKMKLKLMKLWSSALIFSHVKSTGILA